MADIYGKGPKGKATKLHSLVIRTVGMCERCGSVDNLQCAHIVSRTYNATRTDLRNAFCLCATCHYHFTIHPVEFGKFVVERIGKDLYEELYKLAQSGQKGTKAFWDDRIEFLTDVHKRIIEGELTLWEAKEYEPAKSI